MRNITAKKVSQMDVQIGKMHRELAKLYEERAKLMQSQKISYSTTSDIDFPTDMIDELVKEGKKASRGKK
jgi:hypothetical protein